jgi:hypothetical protein
MMRVHRIDPRDPIEPGADFAERQREKARSLAHVAMARRGERPWLAEGMPIGRTFTELCCRCQDLTTWVQKRGYQHCTVCLDRFPCRGDCRHTDCQYYWAGWAVPPRVGKYRRVRQYGVKP